MGIFFSFKMFLKQLKQEEIQQKQNKNFIKLIRVDGKIVELEITESNNRKVQKYMGILKTYAQAFGKDYSIIARNIIQIEFADCDMAENLRQLFKE